jgi:four helix bundle protein
MDAIVLNQRTKKFAVEIIRFFQSLPRSEEARIIGKQLIRCGTSVAANYRAACRSRSDQEFYAKICIVVEESDELLFWLELLLDAAIIDQKQAEQVIHEADELLKIFSASKKTMKNRLKF